jgi:hypothetical protein
MRTSEWPDKLELKKSRKLPDRLNGRHSAKKLEFKGGISLPFFIQKVSGPSGSKTEYQKKISRSLK